MQERNTCSVNAHECWPVDAAHDSEDLIVSRRRLSSVSSGPEAKELTRVQPGMIETQKPVDPNSSAREAAAAAAVA